MNTFSTTYNLYHNIKLFADGKSVHIYLPNDRIYDNLYFTLQTPDKKKYEKKVNNHNVNHIVLNFKSIQNGKYLLSGYKIEYLSSYCTELFCTNITNSENGVAFSKADVYGNNVNFMTKLSSTNVSKYLNHSDNKSIINKAKEITKTCYDNYQKALIIHDYIAENIIYNLDAFYMNLYNKKSIDLSLTRASDVFNNKKAVCSGYGDLAQTMMRAIGLPTITIRCFALGASTNGLWTDEYVSNDISNHVINAAYINYRWVFFDTTWDSTTSFKDAAVQSSKKLLSHRYFDPTIELLSQSHKLLSIKQ